LQGIPCIALDDAPPDRTTIMASRSFGRLVTERPEMEEAVASYATRAAEKLRRQNLAAGRLMVFVQTNPWDRWKDPATGEWMLSCTIIVSGASAWMEPYHDRMPVLLEARDFDAWLDGSLGAEVLKPAPAEALREWKVSPRLNRTGVGDDDPTIIKPMTR
jgi:putative SOS response-associated peptidase YedK